MVNTKYLTTVWEKPTVVQLVKTYLFSFVDYDLEEGKALTDLSEQTLWLYKCNSLSLNIKHDL